MIGEYIGSRKNKNILEAFVKSFNFKDVRVDDALRLYLETFRIPGEAPVIQHLLEHFAEQWNAANGNPYANADATFTLSYAILMLNTDQHNVTSRKQNVPMTAEDFKRNLKGMNGGENFEPSLLEKIYYGIREDEIILPSERMGAVKENYLWKVLLRRGATEKGTFIHAASGSFDHDLFTLIWGPTVAALSFVFDKTTDEYIHHKAIAGFRKCAMISAHYGLSDVFDNLVISLCQFTTLLSAVENGYPINLNPESLPYSFGRNEKARLAAKTVFNLAFRHADILRDGWKNLLDCLLQLYKAHLLPEDLIIVEDYINPKKQIRLIEEPQKNSQKQELGMFSSFYLYFTSDSSSHRGPSAEEQECRKKALECIKECHIEQLLEDSKFLQDTSLGELIKALISVTKGDCTHDALSYHYDDDARVFSHELLIRVMLQNRDRMTLLWPLVRNHFYEMAICSMDPSFLLERTVVGLLRLAHRLLRRHEMADQGYTCLDLVGILKPHLLYKLARQVVYGLYELLQTHAASLGHCAVAWRQIFTLLEVCGAGIYTPPERRAEMVERLAFLPQEKYLMDSNAGTRGSTGTIPNVHDPHHDEMASPDSACMSGCESGHGTGSIPNFTAVSDCEPSFHAAADATAWRGYTSDSELHHTTMKTGGPVNSDWILVNSEADIESTSPPNQMEHDVSHSFIHSSGAVILYSEALPPVNQYSIVLQEEFRNHNSRALFKAVEILVFLVRDPAYVNIINFRYCVRALRVFVEASVNGGSHLSTTIHANASARRSQRPTNASSRNAPAGSHKRHGENLQKSSQNRFTANSSMKRNRSNPSGMTTADAHPRQMTSSSSIHSIPRGRGSPSSRNYNSTKQKPHGGYSASASSAESDYEDDLGEEGGNASGNAQRASTKAMNQSLSVQNKNIRMVLQLLELMYTLHTRAASIFTESEKDMDPSSKEGVHGHRATAYPNQVYNNVGATLWDECWCPLLQGIARLCCDARRTIRTQALTYLQRALLAPDLHRLNAGEWEDCFTKVLFPLLSCLLEDVNPADPTGMEETRMRASTLLSKVFLQHLTPLLSLPTFTALWLTILDFMDRYIHVSGSDLLSEAVPESLKNMLLVMDTANVLNRPGANTNEELSSSGPREAVIWRLTWDRISTFLPDLQQELFPESIPTHHVAPLEEEKASVPAPATKESIVALQPRASVNDELKLFHPEHEPLTRSEHETPEPTSDMIDDHSVVIAIPDSPPAEYNNPMDFSEKSIVEEASVVAQNEEPLSEEKLPRGRVVHDL